MNFATSFGLSLLALFVLPVLVSGCLPDGRNGVPWYEARRDPTGLAPDPATTPQAVIQVYAARAVSWRGIFSVHTWIAVKPTGAERYTRYECSALASPQVPGGTRRPDGTRQLLVRRPTADRVGPARTRCRRDDRQDPCRSRQLPLSARISRLARPQQQHLHRLYCPPGLRARP